MYEVDYAEFNFTLFPFMKKYVTEYIGTFFLVLAIGLTGNALSSGLFIIPVIYIGAWISGAHYNPAITLSFWATGNLSIKSTLFYVISQTLGAAAGVLMIFYLAGTTLQTVPASSVTPIQYGSVELLFLLLLSLLYLTLFLSDACKNNNIHGIAIGLSYAGILMIGEPVSGGVFNPAIAAAASFIDYFNTGDSYLYLPIFFLAPSVGGILAGNLFSFLSNRNPVQPKEG
jgi:glycerol uptake facilitator-like aquaporin